MRSLFFLSVDSDYDARHNREADPLFVDPESFDFRLTEESPAIDIGKFDQAPSEDFFGTPRPQSDGIDIGAHEFDTSD